MDWGALLEGLGSIWGYTDQMDRLKGSRDDLSTAIGETKQYVTDNATFNPYTVRSPMGSINFNEDGMKYNLNPRQTSIQNQMFDQGQGMLGRAYADPAQREQEIYDRIRAVQQPEEARARDAMNANLFASGRGGMSTAAYGGTPEQHAFEKARAEAQNQAMLGAMGQTQNELMNQYTMGQGMLQSGYLPSTQQLAYGSQGMNYGSMKQNADLARSGLMSQLMLGGATADANYQRLYGDLINNAIQASGPMIHGFGDFAGGLLNEGWDFLTDLFGDRNTETSQDNQQGGLGA